ncbi:DNA-directed RNA polymerase subunit delta [Spirochaetia bacterium]|nr:DNA-directed RNA polymerase subunit delta [Spirochaetia bacterium]
MKRIVLILVAVLVITGSVFGEGRLQSTSSQKAALVFQTDFGLKDGAVSAMKGVAYGVDSRLFMADITHEIPPYSIWDAAYRLYQTAEYWPEGTVFVSVVDPGVGTERKSIVLRTNNNQYFVTPDNGTLTLIAEKYGISEIREIDEESNRLTGSEKSYTFYGRDVYAYTGARLAAGILTFENVGKKLPNEIVSLPYRKAEFRNGSLYGTIPALDIQYGNVWTNIDRAVSAGFNLAINKNYLIEISYDNTVVYSGVIPFVNTFDDVPEGDPLMYYNSLDCLSFAINMDSFADTHGISYGGEWQVRISAVN